MITIQIQPLTSNRAWAGRRLKSKEYKQYEVDVCKLLSFCTEEKDDTPLFISYTFYIKNYGLRDVDNMVKPLQDLLVKRGYIKDDRYIKAMMATKERVKNLIDEKIEIRIEPYLKQK